MSDLISFEKAKEILNGLMGQAEGLIGDPSKVENLLQKMEELMKNIPVVGTSLSRLPLMISMIRSYIRKEYTEVSPKVIALTLCAIIYLLKGKDLIPDKTPVIGYADDIAVFGAALRLTRDELNAYAEWRASKEGGNPDGGDKAADDVVVPYC